MKENSEQYPIVCQKWLERGWGGSVKPDGYSLHLFYSDRDKFIKEYWDSMPDEPPDEYSKPYGQPTLRNVSQALHHELKALYVEGGMWKHGVRVHTIYDSLAEDLRKSREAGDFKKSE
jgi:hypothetical protein